jgi:membrane-associated phospholipid phosphatase
MTPSAQMDFAAEEVADGRESLQAKSLAAAKSYRRWFWRFGLPALWALLGVAALPIDLPLAHWFHEKNLPDGLRKACDLSEVFGHGLGVLAILLAAWVLAPQFRRRLPRVIFCAYFSGAIALAGKLLLARTRPNRAMLEGIIDVQSTFKGLFPWLSTGFPLQSFPSGHTATAVGLAIGLSWLLPRGKWLFACFTLLVAAQRIVGGFHFLSDTLWAAAVGWLCASACLPGGWLSRPFDRWETRRLTR